MVERHSEMLPVNPKLRGYYLTSYIGLIILLVLYGLVAGSAAPSEGYPYDTYDQPSDPPPLIALCLLFVMVPLTFVWIGSALRWLHDAWSSVPEDDRHVPAFGAVSPGMVVGLFFVPCLNYFWMFLVNISLANAINRSLEARGSSARCTTGLAIAACCLQMVPYCNFLFAPILWFLWMRDLDRAREHLMDIDAGAVAEVFS